MLKKFNCLLVGCLLLFTAISIIADVGTTSEAVNPFNEFMSPQGGVNLFSGDVAFPYELYKLPGRNGMDVSIKLRYSSNVYSQVRGRNDIAPTSWVGLGWDLGFGSIMCDHKNTMTLRDDEYYWVSAEGVKKKMLRIGLDVAPTFYLKDEPYWRVTRITEDVSSIIIDPYFIKGWVLTDPTGKQYKYGDPDGTHSDRLATRYTYCWSSSKHVGEGYKGSPENYPYQWDLAEITDLFGNSNVFEYDTVAEALKCAVNTTEPELEPELTKLYTKASYLKKITNPQGDYILFETEKKKETEYLDPYTLRAEPDGFIELFETKQLKAVKVYSGGSLLKSFSLCYEQISPFVQEDKKFRLRSGGPRHPPIKVPAKQHQHWQKSILQSITELNASDKSFGSSRFTYYDNHELVNDENYHFGALESLILPRCGKITYEYKKQNTRFSSDRAVDYTEAIDENGTTRKLDLPIKAIVGGTTRDGHDFWLDYSYSKKTDNAKSTHEVSRLLWDGVKWRRRWHLNPIVVPDDQIMEPLRLAAGDGMYAVVIPDKYLYNGVDRVLSESYALEGASDNILIYAWNSETKNFENIFSKSFGVKCKVTAVPGERLVWPTQIYFGNDMWLVAVFNPMGTDGENFIGTSTIYAYRYNRATQTWKEKIFYNDNLNPVLSVGNNFFVVYNPDPNDEKQTWKEFQKFKVCRWDGEAWHEEEKEFTKSGGRVVWAGQDCFFAHYSPGNKKYYIYSYKWDGQAWTQASSREEIKYADTELHASVQPDYACFWTKKKRRLNVFKWTGEEWWRPSTFTNRDEGSDKHLHLKTAPEIFAPVLPVKGEGVWNTVRAYNWDGNTLERTYNGRLNLHETGENSFSLGHDFIVGSKYKNANGYWQRDLNINGITWNGTEWKSEELINKKTSDYAGGRVFDPTVRTTSGSVLVPMQMVSSRSNTLDQATINGTKILLYKKYQESFNTPLFSYACTSKVLDNAITGEVSRLYFDYDAKSTENFFNTSTGTAEYSKVKVKLPGAGSTTYYYHCRPTNPYQGMIKKVENLDMNDELVSKDSTVYNRYRRSEWPGEWPGDLYHKRAIIKRDTLNGVGSVTTFTYNDANGLLRSAVTKNSDGTKKITKNTYAHEVARYQSHFTQKNMLSQLAQTTIYEQAAASTGEPTLADARSSTINTYTFDAAKNIYAACSTVAWCEASASSGLPAFDHGDFSKNDYTKWLLQRLDTSYTIYGNVQETRNGMGERIVTIYGHKGTLPIAQVNGAKLQECAFLTGDYSDEDLASGSYYDRENGWRHNWSGLSNPPKRHFGQKAIHVSNLNTPEIAHYGPRQALAGFTPQDDYIFSAWVYPTIVSETSPIMMQVVKNSTGLDVNPEGAAKSAGLKIGEWNYIQRIIDKDALSGFTNNEKLTISITAEKMAEFYLEDIRFYPKNALVTTIFYDQLYKTPVAVVDANNKAKWTGYNDFGLASKEYRCDVKGNATLLSETEYGFMRCNPNTLGKRLANLSSTLGLANFSPDQTTYSISVDNSVTQLNIAAIAENPDAKLGISAPTIAGYELDCPCGIDQTIPLLETANTPVTVTVRAPDGSTRPYTVNVKRLANCWIMSSDQSVSNNSIESNLLALSSETPYVAFKDGTTGRAVVRYMDNQVWSTAGGGPASPNKADNISFGMNGSVPYIAYSDIDINPEDDDDNDGRLTVRRLNAGAWADVGSAGIVSISAVEKSELAFVGPTPYAAYIADKNAELAITADAEAARVFVKQYNGTAWVAVPPATNGIVSENGAKSFTLAISGSGEPYVAFVYENDDESANDINDGKLFVRNFQSGNWVDVGSGAVSDGSVRDVALTFVSSTPFIAFSEELSDADLLSNNHDPKTSYKLRVKKYNGSNWVDASPGMLAVAFLSSDDQFEIKTLDSKPTLFLTNINNNSSLSAAQFDGTTWVSFSNPAFAPTPKSAEDVFSTAVSPTGTPFVAFRNAFRNNEPSVMQYQSGCPDVNLTSLTVSSTTGALDLIPSFRQYITNYATNVKSSTGSIVVTVQTRGAAIVTIGAVNSTSAIVAIEPGENEIPIVVTSTVDNETQAIYVLKVFRPYSSYASLCGLNVYNEAGSDLSYSPSFNPNVPSYSLSVGADIGSIMIQPNSTNAARITVAGKSHTSGYYSTPIPLKYGLNRLPITLTAPDGQTRVEYQLSVTRSADPAIALSGLSLSAGTLVPAFNANKFEYEASVANTVASVTVTPSAASAEIVVNGEDVNSGVASSAIDLSFGSNNIFVETSNPVSGKTAQYVIKLSKEPSDDLALSALSIVDDQPSTVALTPGFDRDRLVYTANVSADVNSITIAGSLVNPSSTFTVDDVPYNGSPKSVNLDPGVNIVECIVTSQDGINDVIYTINVQKALSYITPEVSFEKIDIRKAESVGEIKIPVLLSSAPTANVTVNYSVTGGTATGGGTDYTLANGTLTFLPCEAKKEITISIIDDKLIEADETIEIMLTSPNNATLGDAKILKFTILDNDLPTVSFAAASSIVNESAATKAISVTISTNPTKPVEVNFDVTGGTATKGTDFSYSSNTVLFNPGDALTKTIVIDIVNDVESEGDETAVFELLNVINAEYGSITKHILTIVDDDQPFVVEFVATSGSGDESQEWVQIPVAINRLHTISEAPVTVDYTVTGVNGAVAGTDFVLANGQLTWGYCSGGCGTAQNISLQILGDGDYDPGEGVEITLSNPVNAILGDKKTFTYTINDAPPILFTSPTGGQYHVGETVQIQWQTLDPTISSVNLELSMDNGMSWELLKCDASMQNTDSDWENYSWTIPATSCGGSALGGSTILVKVSSAMQPDIFSKSGPMSILPPALVITTPTSGSFRIGETMQIQWQTNDLAIEAVNLLVSRDNGMSWELINCGASISRTDPQWQNYAWIIPTQTCEGNGLQASNILLMVASSEQPNVNAKAGPFTILENIPPTIHITVPTDQPRLTYSLPIHRIAGEAWDNVGVTSVTYTLSGHTIDDGLAEGLENWSVDNLNIGPGTTTVTVTAHDAAGNSAVDILVIDIGYD